ncbi:MAG: glycosyltransferase [Chloroflexota bacterium]
MATNMDTHTTEKIEERTIERAPEDRSESPGEVTASYARAKPSNRPVYIPIKTKFVIATGAAAVWFSVSLYLALPWLEDLSRVVGAVPAILIILSIALIPGFLNAHILTSIVLDKPPPLRLDITYPPLSLLIAAYNEADNIAETLRGISMQDYPGKIEVVVVDDGSSDRTVEVLASLKMPNLKIVKAKHGGKAHALNEGLDHVRHEIVVTIDADTFLHPQALKRIVARMLTDPPHTAAVAGCVLVKNSRETFMARLQEWDYFTGIASAKRQQSLYQGTLVAQGAFSAFRTDAVRRTKGWPSVIGEDIVLTWALLQEGWRIGFEASAVGFTRAPTDFKGFFRQRKRWARGMIEALKRHGALLWRRSRLASFFIGVDFVIPLIDIFYTFAFLPGLALALTGRFYIAGPMTLLVFPIAFFIVSVMYHKQKQVFDSLNLTVRSNPWGLVVYMLIYQAIMSPICVVGYVQEILGAVKKW